MFVTMVNDSKEFMTNKVIDLTPIHTHLTTS